MKMDERHHTCNQCYKIQRASGEELVFSGRATHPCLCPQDHTYFAYSQNQNNGHALINMSAWCLIPMLLMLLQTLISRVTFTTTLFPPICKIRTVRINDLFIFLFYFQRFWFYSISPCFYHYCLNCYRDNQSLLRTNILPHYIEKTVDMYYDVLWVSKLYRKKRNKTKRRGCFANHVSVVSTPERT